MIRIVPFIGFPRDTGHDRILRILLVRPPYLCRPSHGNTMIITGTALSAHDVIISVPLRQMRGLDTSPVRTSPPHLLRITDDRLRCRVILHHADRPRLLIAFPCLPLQRYHIFPAVAVMEHGRIKPRGMYVYRTAPRPADIPRRDHIIIHVKISGIHRVHYSIHHIEQIFFLTVSQTRCPDSFCTWKLL